MGGQELLGGKAASDPRRKKWCRESFQRFDGDKIEVRKGKRVEHSTGTFTEKN